MPRNAIWAHGCCQICLTSLPPVPGVSYHDNLSGGDRKSTKAVALSRAELLWPNPNPYPLQAAAACKYDLSGWLGELNVDLNQVGDLVYISLPWRSLPTERLSLVMILCHALGLYAMHPKRRRFVIESTCNPVSGNDAGEMIVHFGAPPGAAGGGHGGAHAELHAVQ